MENTEVVKKSDVRKVLVRAALIAIFWLFVLSILFFSFVVGVFGMDKYSYCGAWQNITPQDCDAVWNEFNYVPSVPNVTYGNSTVVTYLTITNNYSRPDDSYIKEVMKDDIEAVKKLCAEVENEYLEEQVEYYKKDNSWLRNGSLISVGVNMSVSGNYVPLSDFDIYKNEIDSRLRRVELGNVVKTNVKGNDNTLIIVVVAVCVIGFFVWRSGQKKKVVVQENVDSGLSEMLKYVKDHKIPEPPKMQEVKDATKPIL